MPRPYSVDLRERVLLACEAAGVGYTETARRFRVGVSKVRLWRQQARDEGRRTPLPLGRRPVPFGGRLEALSALAAERNDATLAEYADLLAARTGERRSTAVICRALKQLGWVRKQRRCGRASAPKCGAFAAGTERTWLPPERSDGPKLPGSTRPG